MVDIELSDGQRLLDGTSGPKPRPFQGANRLSEARLPVLYG